MLSSYPFFFRACFILTLRFIIEQLNGKMLESITPEEIPSCTKNSLEFAEETFGFYKKMTHNEV